MRRSSQVTGEPVRERKQLHGGGELGSEQQLAIVLAGVRGRRDAVRVRRLLGEADHDRLLELLDRLAVSPLLGTRLLDAVPDLQGPLRASITTRIEAAKPQGILLEHLTLAVTARLAEAGIRALPLKGAVLARDLHGDPWLRSSTDIDLLVDATDLEAAVRHVEAQGWQHHPNPKDRGRPPDLHEVLYRPRLPRVEVHWRLHWLEDRFASDALARARLVDGSSRLRMAPEDEFASLLLFYARDGFSGLRLAADISAWWDQHGQSDDLGSLLDPIADRYEALAGSLSVASSVLGQLIGLPRWGAGQLPLRSRTARAIANPLLEGVVPQIFADRGLVDVLLAPHGQLRSTLSRQLIRFRPDQNEEAAATGRRPRNSVVLHAGRVIGRWMLSIVRAVPGALLSS